ncbi:hypothetical protein HPP92_018429 [Vanilla planifolia]|uniref:EF-hand domain-containing protein n=1 Tax=Vanilla planifolia TaxID=51239 RepID=A0A835QE31_VANPL|nr:hypothetical protein HPP92_019042 [Vanilla planifolia]KAG0469101.1 hypothetical protein HPP92_018429 [Vanilla planifolia]
MAGASPQSPEKKALPRPELFHSAPSFRLRSSSLNSVRLRRIFDLFDRNGDGVITAEELLEALGQLGICAEMSEVQSLVDSFLHADRTDLDFDSFSSLHHVLGDVLFGKQDLAPGGQDESEEEDMWEAFRVFDEDGDGYISDKELQAVLGKLGLVEGRSIDRVHRMIGSVDLDHDGRVDFFEFKSMMKSVAVRSS